MTISTNRLTLDEFKSVHETCLVIVPSPHKVGWAKITLYKDLGTDQELYRNVFRGKGFREVGSATSKMRTVHFSLTDIGLEDLMKIGFATPIQNFLRTVVIKQLYTVGEMRESEMVGDVGIYAITYDGTSAFVTAKSVEDIYTLVEQQQRTIQRNALQWYTWVAEAKLSVIEGCQVYTFGNGLTVRFVIDGNVFCQTGWDDDYRDHETPDEFYLYLTRFF